MNSDFNLVSEVINKTLIMRTDGYINNLGGEKIAEEYTKHENSGLSKVVMDLKKSKVVNSIGISYLLEVIERLNTSNSKLIFANLDPTIEKTFKIMGLFQFAELAESVDSALLLGDSV